MAPPYESVIPAKCARLKNRKHSDIAMDGIRRVLSKLRSTNGPTPRMRAHRINVDRAVFADVLRTTSKLANHAHTHVCTRVRVRLQSIDQFTNVNANGEEQRDSHARTHARNARMWMRIYKFRQGYGAACSTNGTHPYVFFARFSFVCE